MLPRWRFQFFREKGRNMKPSRRELLAVAGTAALVGAKCAGAAEPSDKVYRIGVVSACNAGKPQPRNGHTWSFAQYFHPRVNLDAIKKYMDPGNVEMFHKYMRN